MYEELQEIAHGDPWMVRKRLLEWIALNVDKPKPLPRTSKQNKALHVDCQLIAEKLNDAGLDQRKVLKPEIDIPWTMEAVKERIWKPVMKTLYGHDSTKDLKIQREIELIHETIMRHLGEKHGVEWHDFPTKQHEKQT